MTIDLNGVHQANYIDGGLDEYRGNPLVEALPAIPSQDDWLAILARRPVFNVAERQLADHIRSHCLPRLLRFFIPLPHHRELAQLIDLMLRQGYVARNPMSKDRVATLLKAKKMADGKALQHASDPNDTSTVLCSSLCGISGAGKSTTTQLVLAHYPQVIAHPDHQFVQVVWIKVSCPSDGSLVALCKAIIKEFDRLLGTAFMRSCGARPSLDDLLAVVAMCSLNYNLGLLVIDEIQNLSVKKGGGRESMLNFFQNLANDFKLPVLLIGTMKALHLLEGSFRTARRATAVGSMQWSMMPLDATWNALVKIFWQFQWIRKPVPLTEELVSKLHSMTCGVVSLLVALLFAAQLNAIRNKSETVTLASLEKTLREDFKPLKPLLDALRSGDMRRIAQYDDMMSSGFWDRLKHEAMAPVPSVDVPRDSAAQTQDEWRKAVVALVTMGYPESDVEAALAGAKKAGASTAPKLVPLALKSLQGVDAEDERGDPNDLRLTKS